MGTLRDLEMTHVWLEKVTISYESRDERDWGMNHQLAVENGGFFLFKLLAPP